MINYTSPFLSTCHPSHQTKVFVILRQRFWYLLLRTLAVSWTPPPRAVSRWVWRPQATEWRILSTMRLARRFWRPADWWPSLVTNATFVSLLFHNWFCPRIMQNNTWPRDLFSRSCFLGKSEILCLVNANRIKTGQLPDLISAWILHRFTVHQTLQIEVVWVWDLAFGHNCRP